eukprot:6177443-Pleurochrysis_carterae.AAC.1
MTYSDELPRTSSRHLHFVAVSHLERFEPFEAQRGDGGRFTTKLRDLILEIALAKAEERASEQRQ